MIMAKAVKGCLNKECVANQEKKNFGEHYDFCPKCGQPLSYVCKDCRMALEDNSRKYCVRCESKHKDDREQIGKVVVGKAADGAKNARNFATGTAKKAADSAANVAGGVKKRVSKIMDNRKMKK